MSVPPLSWRRRACPLPAVAVIGSGPVAHRLASATLVRLAAGAPLRAAADPQWLIVLGDEIDLPWSDGVVYLGWAAGALVPTTMSVSPGPRIVRAALGCSAADFSVILPERIIVGAMPVRDADPRLLTSR